MKTTDAELRILERARRAPACNALPAPASLTLTAPVRRPVQVSLFGGPIALGLPSDAPAKVRHLALVMP